MDKQSINPMSEMEKLIKKKNNDLATMSIIIIVLGLMILVITGGYMGKSKELVEYKRKVTSYEEPYCKYSEVCKVCNDPTINELSKLILFGGIAIGLIFHGFPFKFSSYSDNSVINEIEKENKK